VQVGEVLFPEPQTLQEAAERPRDYVGTRNLVLLIVGLSFPFVCDPCCLQFLLLSPKGDNPRSEGGWDLKFQYQKPVLIHNLRLVDRSHR
jgi:hypothetical protein